MTTSDGAFEQTPEDISEDTPEDSVVDAEDFQKRQQVAWELELLISGALVMSLFKVPGWLTRTGEQFVYHSSGNAGLLPDFIFYILKMVVLALLGTFLVHFVVRSFWVGLIGLRGAYPRGVSWRSADFNPIQTEIYKRHAPTLGQLEERSDRLASSMFALLFLATFMILVSLFSAMPSYFLARLLQRFVWPEAELLTLFMIFYFALIAPMLLANLLDRALKSRPQVLERLPWLRRGIAAVLTLYHYLFLGPLHVPLTAVFSTHTSKRWVTSVSVALSLVLGVIMLGTQVSSAGGFGYDSYVFFPRDAKESGSIPLPTRASATRRKTLAFPPFSRTSLPILTCGSFCRSTRGATTRWSRSSVLSSRRFTPRASPCGFASAPTRPRSSARRASAAWPSSTPSPSTTRSWATWI